MKDEINFSVRSTPTTCDKQTQSDDKKDNSKTSSGEEDYKAINHEIKRVLTTEDEDQNEHLNLSTTNTQYLHSDPVLENLMDNNIWTNNNDSSQEDTRKFKHRFRNLASKSAQLSKMQVLKISNKYYQKNSSNEVVKVEKEVDESIVPVTDDTINQLGSMGIKANNLKSINTSFISTISQKCYTAPTESCQLKDYFYTQQPDFYKNTQSIFPRISRENRQNSSSIKVEDSFDHSICEENNDFEIRKRGLASRVIEPRLLTNNNSRTQLQRENPDRELKKQAFTPKHNKPQTMYSNMSNINRNLQSQYSLFHESSQHLSLHNHQSYSLEQNQLSKLTNINFPQFTKPSFEYRFPQFSGANSYLISYNNEKKKLPIMSNGEVDPRVYQINLMEILEGKDNRATLMIKNIPNKYDIPNMIEDINTFFYQKYDFLYLPLDFKNNCNLGFAFINFLDPLHILMFDHLYSGKTWKKYKSEKKCEIAYAKIQGKKELINHFKKTSQNSSADDERKPIVLNSSYTTPVEIPIVYYNAFSSFYPNAQFKIVQNSIVISNLYG